MLIRRPRSLSRFRYPAASGNMALSKVKSHHWYDFIQKQSKWKTPRGISLSWNPSRKLVTVSSLYDVVKP